MADTLDLIMDTDTDMDELMLTTTAMDMDLEPAQIRENSTTLLTPNRVHIQDYRKGRKTRIHLSRQPKFYVRGCIKRKNRRKITNKKCVQESVSI